MRCRANSASVASASRPSTATHSAATPALRATSSAPASCLSEITSAILPGAPSRVASSRAWRLEPRPDTSTAMGTAGTPRRYYRPALPQSQRVHSRPAVFAEVVHHDRVGAVGRQRELDQRVLVAQRVVVFGQPDVLPVEQLEVRVELGGAALDADALALAALERPEVGPGAVVHRPVAGLEAA